MRETRYRPSPIPSGGLEIPVLLIFKRNDATNEVFEKMEKLINDFYVEPEKIKNKSSKDFHEDIVEEILAKIVGLMVKA